MDERITGALLNDITGLRIIELTAFCTAKAHIVVG